MYQLMHVACFKSLIEDNKIIGGGNLDTYITTRQRSSRNFEKECTWCFQVYSFFYHQTFKVVTAKLPA